MSPYILNQRLNNILSYVKRNTINKNSTLQNIHVKFSSSQSNENTIERMELSLVKP